MNTSNQRWEVQLLLRGQTQTARGSGAVRIPQPVIWNKTAVKNAKKRCCQMQNKTWEEM